MPNPFTVILELAGVKPTYFTDFISFKLTAAPNLFAQTPPLLRDGAERWGIILRFQPFHGGEAGEPC